MIAEPQLKQHTTLRFLLKLVLYVLPFAIPFLLLSSFMIYTGESIPLGIVARLQMGDQPVLYRPRFGYRDMDLKILSANLRQPDILTVGSSRVLQFRSLFFNKQPREFYNAGGPAWLLQEVQHLLENLTYTPRIVIIGLDQPWFNDNYYGAEIPPSLNDFSQIFGVNRGFMQEAILGEPFNMGRYLARVEPAHGGLALGFRAIRDGHGFRNDGSEQYGDFLVAHWLSMPDERQRALDELRDGLNMYAYGDTVWSDRVQNLENLLIWCKARDITVIAFLPSFMPTLYQKLIADGNHTYVQKLDGVLAPLLAKYGDYYFNFSDGAALGATDEDFFDGWHASEKINLRLYEQMLKALPDVLDAYSDPAVLQADDEGATDSFEVFGNRVS